VSSRAKEKAAARERVAAMRAEQARVARRRRLLLAGGSIGLVLVVVLALVLASVAGLGGDDDETTTTSRGEGGAAQARAVEAVTSVPAAVLDEVGVGTVQVTPKPVDTPALTEDGKPKVLYVGAEFCPFCASQRWPLAVALSRFGTWSDLSTSRSASDDVFPDTPTLSFSGAGYTSDHLAFTGYETATNEKVGGRYAPLDRLSAEDQEIFDTYNRPPYTEGSPGGIPFLDLGGRYVSGGASVSPELLAGKTPSQVAAALDDPDDPVAKAVNGSANVLTAALCELTGGEPADVCTSAGVTAAQPLLRRAAE
jgi:hypothetical protein